MNNEKTNFKSRNAGTYLSGNCLHLAERFVVRPSTPLVRSITEVLCVCAPNHRFSSVCSLTRLGPVQPDISIPRREERTMSGRILGGGLSIPLLTYLAPIITAFAASLTRPCAAFEPELCRVITIKATLRTGVLY